MKLVYHTVHGTKVIIRDVEPEYAQIVLDGFAAYANGESFDQPETEDVVQQEPFLVDLSQIVAIDTKREASDA